MGDFWAELGRALVLDAPYNTSLVMRSVAVLGASCGTIGVFLLLRKRSLVADALAHAALPGVCAGFFIALAFGQDAMSLPILLPAAAVAGVLGVACIHGLRTLPRVREDAAIGIVLSVFFAIGVVMLGIIQDMPVTGRAGLRDFIFGQAATLSSADGRLILVAALMVIVVTAALFKELRLLCFDPSFAQSIGFPRGVLDAALMGLVTALTVIGLHAVGALLMVALLIIPAVAARLWTDRLWLMMLVSSAIGAAGAYVGAGASAAGERVPTGAAIVLACGGLFVLSLLIAPRRGIVMAAVRQLTLRARIARQHLLRAMYERGEIAGDLTAPVTADDLRERRAWNRPHLTRLLRRAMRHSEIETKENGFVLTAHGRSEAVDIVRTHRLWEHYLTARADVAPSHVDEAVEDIEHVLGEDIVAELERSLRKEAHGKMPPSPHALSEADQQNDGLEHAT